MSKASLLVLAEDSTRRYSLQVKPIGLKSDKSGIMQSGATAILARIGIGAALVRDMFRHELTIPVEDPAIDGNADQRGDDAIRCCL
jgi:hypothetical protein